MLIEKKDLKKSKKNLHCFVPHFFRLKFLKQTWLCILQKNYLPHLSKSLKKFRKTFWIFQKNFKKTSKFGRFPEISSSLKKFYRKCLENLSKFCNKEKISSKLKPEFRIFFLFYFSTDCVIPYSPKKRFFP